MQYNGHSTKKTQDLINLASLFFYQTDLILNAYPKMQGSGLLRKPKL